MSRYARRLFGLALFLVLPWAACAGTDGIPDNASYVSHDNPAVQYNRVIANGSHGSCTRSDGACSNAWWVEPNEGNSQKKFPTTHTTQGRTASLTVKFSGSTIFGVIGKGGNGCKAFIDGHQYDMQDGDGTIFLHRDVDGTKEHTFFLNYSASGYLSVAAFAVDPGARIGGESPPAPSSSPVPPTPEPRPPSPPPSQSPTPKPPPNTPPQTPVQTPSPSSPAPGGGAQAPTSVPADSSSTTLSPSTPPGGSSTDSASGGSSTSNPSETISPLPPTTQLQDHNTSPTRESSLPGSEGSSITGGVDSGSKPTSLGGSNGPLSPSQVPPTDGGTGGRRSNGAVIGGAVVGGLLLLLLLLLLWWLIRRWIRARRAPSYAFRNGAAGFEIVNFASARPESSVPDSWEPFPEFPEPPNSEMTQRPVSGPIGIAV